MNIRLLTGLIFLVIIAVGLGVFFMNEKNTQDLKQRMEAQSQTASPSPEDTGLITIRSNDNRVSFQYPDEWMINETTGVATRGKFGPIVQSWIVQNYPIVTGTQTAMADNNAQVTITIQGGGSNLPIDALLDCSMKTVTCDKIGIDNEQFLTSDTVLNTGREILAVASFYDQNILIGEAVIAPGSDQEQLKKTVTDILHSFKFSGNSPVND